VAAAPQDRPQPCRPRELDQPDRSRLDAVLRRVLPLALYPLLRRINAYLVRWLREKLERLRPFNKAKACWQRVTRQDPSAFAHWAWVSLF